MMEMLPVMSLSSSVVRIVMEYWLGEQKAPGEPLDEFLDAQVPNALDRRRLTRQLESLTGIVMASISADLEYEQLDDTSRSRVVDTVRLSLHQAALSPADLKDAGLEPARLITVIWERSTVANALDLTEPERRFHDVLLAKTASVLITAASAFPESSPYVVAELLRDGGEIGGIVRSRLGELPTAGDDAYRLAIVTSLDQAEIVGFTLPAAMRKFSLSKTYSRPRITVKGDEMPVEWALADSRRLYLTGPAGSGKTALMRWLAVDGARKSLDGLLATHNELLPIYVPGSRLGDTPEKEPSSVVDFIFQYARPSLRPSLSPAELNRRCDQGNAILLIDGLDEFGQGHLPRIRKWLNQLVERYPECRFVVSSRQAAIDPAYLADLGFTVASLKPLDDSGVTDLVTRWFATVGPVVPERTGRRLPIQLGKEVVRLIRSNPQLRELATSPLMCTLVCGVYLDRGPEWLRGSNVYEAFVEMLIERRDVERGLGRVRLPRSIASIFLEELAGLMLQEGWIELPRSRVLDQFALTSRSLTKQVPDPSEVLDSLLVESGVLVEPEKGRIRFLHLTFLEYLAAQNILHNGRADMLVARAHEPLWRATFVMAVAQARHREAEKLVLLLVARFEGDPHRRRVLAGVLQECLQSAQRLEPYVRGRVNDVVEQLSHEFDESWQLWLSTSESAVADSLESWLLAEPALRREGGLAFVANRRARQHPAPYGMMGCLSLTMTGLIPVGDLVNAMTAWRAAQHDQNHLEIVLVVPESSVSIRISPHYP
ncbi:NACHT domain-containing protein [Micromonospora sp. NPDC047644]|uniref:NACHT domain-containing protein n=1 Tax=Micromonospora sp. NPDC047644 TaxID=3157203 RepID=UPI00345737E2